jgi:hypothetical protein
MFFFFFSFCRDLESEAEKIAFEIENNQTYKDRIEVENGDEEAAFAAVTRPQVVSPQPSEKGKCSQTLQFEYKIKHGKLVGLISQQLTSTYALSIIINVFFCT